jgi:hypothetical protein
VSGLSKSWKGNVPESWDCVDCGVNTAPGCKSRVELETAMLRLGDRADTEGVTQSINDRSEVYHLRNHVWERAGIEPFGGCLCIGCLEKRIGRVLRPNDFKRGHPFNVFPGTPRLLKRRGNQR